MDSMKGCVCEILLCREVGTHEASSCCCRGTLAVAADSLGRVLLIDCVSATVLRVFKGYRAAQCAWLSLPLPRSRQQESAPPDQAAGSMHGPERRRQADEGAASNSAKRRHVESGEVRQQARGMGGCEERAQQQLCLALHAPWRGVIDVWAMTHGEKVCSLSAGPGCCLLAGPPVFGAAERSSRATGSGGGTGMQQQGAWMLNCANGALRSVEAAVLEALA
jgi:hypothetical protein